MVKWSVLIFSLVPVLIFNTDQDHVRVDKVRDDKVRDEVYYALELAQYHQGAHLRSLDKRTQSRTG